MAQKLTKRLWDTLQRGAGTGLLLYPSLKTVWAVDSMAKNFIGTALPQELRTPLVGLLLSAIPQLFSSGRITDRFSDMLMASALVQTIQQAGNAGTGGPGVIDNAVNKVFAPIAKMGMAGYVGNRRMRGYVGGPGKLRGYVGQQGTHVVTSQPAPSSLNGSAVRGNGMRGWMSEYQ